MTQEERDKYDSLLKGLKTHPPRGRESNLFSIGGRGYYENPTTDMLAFFLDPTGEHDLGNLVLSCILECLQLNNVSPSLERPPIREYYTYESNRIDLVLEGENWVIAIENKLMHKLINNLVDYKSSITDRFVDKEKHFVVLSLREEKPKEPWKCLRYEDFIHLLKARFGENLVSSGFTKWAIFLREFILNIESYMASNMDSKDFEFARTKYADFKRLEILYRNYTNELKNKVRKWVEDEEDIDPPELDVRKETWSSEVAIRAYPLDPNERVDDVTLLVCEDGTFNVLIYIEERNLKKECSDREAMLNQYGFLWLKSEKPKGNSIWVYHKEKLDWEDAEKSFKDAMRLVKEYTKPW